MKSLFTAILITASTLSFAQGNTKQVIPDSLYHWGVTSIPDKFVNQQTGKKVTDVDIANSILTSINNLTAVIADKTSSEEDVKNAIRSIRGIVTELSKTFTALPTKEPQKAPSDPKKP